MKSFAAALRIDDGPGAPMPGLFKATHGVVDLVRCQVRISLGHLDRGVAKKVSNDQQRHASHHQPRGARVPKIVDPEVVDVGFGAEGSEALLNGAQRLRVVPRGGEDPRRRGAMLRAPRGHSIESLKRRRVQRDDPMLFGLGILAFKRYETFLGPNALQAEFQQFVSAAPGVQCQLDKRREVWSHCDGLGYRDHSLGFTPRYPSCPTFWNWQRHAHQSVGQVELVQEVVPVDRGAEVVQLAVDGRRAYSSGLAERDVALDGRTAQAAKCAALEESVKLKLAVPESLRVFARGLVGLHHGLVCRILVDATVVIGVSSFTHAIDRRAGGRWEGGGVWSCCESMVHVSGRPLRPGSVKGGGHARPTFANIWQMMITY